MSLIRAGLAPLMLLTALCGMQAAAQAQRKPPAQAQQKPPAQEQQKPPAQPAPAADLPSGPGLHVLVVDVKSLLDNSKSGKMLRQEIEQKRIEYEKEFQRQEQALQKERNALQRQQSSLSEEAFRKKAVEFQQKLDQLNRSVEAKSQALRRSYGEAVQKIQAAILRIITDVAKQRKANLVFQRSQLVLFDQNFDVTDEVLQKLDEELPTLTVNFVAPETTTTDAPAEEPAAAAKAKRRK